jgi:hypothetical protein
MQEALTTIQGLLEGADIPAESRQAALWCLGQLPGLYQQLGSTYDGRHEDEIRRLAGAAVLKVTGSPVEKAVREHLVGLHRRLGFGVLHLPPSRPPARRSRKAE